jgi:hypothetical protein
VYVAFLIAIVGIVTAVVGVFSPVFVSVIPAFALVFATAVLVAVTNNYVAATDELVVEQKKMLSTQNKQLNATGQLVSAEENQAQAINSEVEALTNAILLVDMQVIQRPTQRPEVVVPVALEVFIQNVGPGEAFDINFTKIEDFVFLVNTTQKKHGDGSTLSARHFNELKIMTDGVERLAPQQKKRLARIVLGDNVGGAREQLSFPRSLSLTYKQHSSTDEIRDSFTLDFPYYFELVDLLDYEANVAIYLR